MEYLPIFIKVKAQSCLVVGCTEKALSKIALLLKADAEITVISPDLCQKAKELAILNKITHLARDFKEEDLKGYKLVISAEDEDDLNQKVYLAAKAQNIPINVVDRPELCDFIFPSIIDRSPLIAAVSTGGASPTLARVIRSRIELMLPHSYGKLAQLIKQFREPVRKHLPGLDDRKRFWDKVFSSSIIEMFLSGKETEAIETLKKAIGPDTQSVLKDGFVCLVGAGPGDSGLLTLSALRQIQNADAIVYDRLIGNEILDFARREAELIYAGKQSSNHTMPQDQINQTLVRLAREGKKVVRLKGGDPFIFGRGGEEVDCLIQEGINFQIIPGVTAASGCGAYFGIPLTHRDYARTCIFATGHLKGGDLELNWESLAQPMQTLVFYMGLSNIKEVSDQLITHGMDKTTPSAIIENGTRPNQRIVTCELSSLSDTATSNDLKPPSLVIVGDVVKLHHQSRIYRTPIQRDAQF
ncbi:MAG: siroheme synthase CysG [Deltaproteobacteria bacterium]|nr:siroheme synthase CysG [Deltaproteobacteria bacterium]